ncbi:MAG TPA: ATP-binding protein [Cyclobacteriaceae bacterium]|nr:ATP-binding protein [Cyclobacteriaceae bacterium]
MEKKLKILLLEDVEDDAGLINWSLEKAGLPFEFKRVDNREEFVDAIRNYQPDVVLSDHSLPRFNSMDALRICRWVNLQAPFILVTGTVSEEFAVTCLKQGADDYVLKSNLTRLPSAIQNALLQRALKSKQRAIELELRMQNEELVKINHELDNFVYSVSHNLRGPVSTVLGLLNLARLEVENPATWNGFIDMMGASLGKLDDRLREILDYSRNARYQVNCEKIDFAQVVQESLDKLSFMEGFHDIRKAIEIKENHEFLSDTYRIKVIVNNLVSNAVQFRDEHKEPSTLTIRAILNNDAALLIIEDNGTGIPDNLTDKVFDMFFRGSVKSDGAGLGLYIVREMVNKLKGKISLESAHGKGTRVSVELPNMRSPLPPDSRETVKEPDVNTSLR